MSKRGPRWRTLGLLSYFKQCPWCSLLLIEVHELQTAKGLHILQNLSIWLQASSGCAWALCCIELHWMYRKPRPFSRLVHCRDILTFARCNVWCDASLKWWVFCPLLCLVVFFLRWRGSQRHHCWLLRSSFCYMQHGWLSLNCEGMMMMTPNTAPTCLATQCNAQSDVPKHDQFRIQPQCCSLPPKCMTVWVLSAPDAVSNHWLWGHWYSEKKKWSASLSLSDLACSRRTLSLACILLFFICIRLEA